MKKLLIIAEHRKGNLKKASLELLSTAKNSEVYGVIFGSQAKSAADELAAKGVKEVYWVQDVKYDHYHPEAFASVCENLIKQVSAQAVVSAASSLGKDLLPKLAARFDGVLASDCTNLDAEAGTGSRPFFAGKASANFSFENSAILFATLRPNSLSAGALPGAGQVKSLNAAFDFTTSPIQYLSSTEASSDRPDLTEANIIVSGGRSLKTKENFKILFDLADTLGAAVGASRAAVDEGLAGHDMQVGQTGKTVNPSLYLAFGISGAIQHLAGMRTSKVIVAINKDPNAPLFQKANYGIVGDLFTLAPLINQECKKLLHKT